MPYQIVKQGKLYYVINADTGKRKNKVGYKTRREALAYLRALYRNVPDASK